MSHNPVLRSGRLELRPLSLTQLGTYMKGNNKLEKELSLAPGNREINPDIRDMVEYYSFPKMKVASDEAGLFLTIWIIIDTTLNEIVAELGFKGTPDQNSEIEVGYATFPHFQGKGYMTEALEIVCRWALARIDVRGVLAETDKTNAASIRVVQKNGFLQFAEQNNMLWWRKSRLSVKRP